MKKEANAKSPRKEVPALKVNQWLKAWDMVAFSAQGTKKKPIPHFFILSLQAKVLRSLSGVERRTLEGRLEGKQDINLQRKLDPERAKEIALFVENGYPWSDLSETKRKDPEYADLRMPGWLPTAVVINVKLPTDVRDSGTVDPKDQISFSEDESGAIKLVLPESFGDSDWFPAGSWPIEVIDGQHRLWAFDNLKQNNFELPVVAFFGLDVSWQAYLFYVINIKPKRLNPSLAYDLYPLLRAEEWLMKSEGHVIYREARAQELTQVLWSHPDSPWHKRINMLGSTGEGEGQVKQASWIRNLINTMIKTGKSSHNSLGGLFGGGDTGAVPWTRTEQGAFLIFIWSELKKEILKVNSEWTIALRQGSLGLDEDLAFSGKHSLLNTDQGVRGFLSIVNDIFMIKRNDLGLDRFMSDAPIGEPTIEDTRDVIKLFLSQEAIYNFSNTLSKALATFDWRTSDAPGLNDMDRTIRKTFRGSGGYREIRVRLLEHLKLNPELMTVAASAAAHLGYDKE